MGVIYTYTTTQPPPILNLFSSSSSSSSSSSLKPNYNLTKTIVTFHHYHLPRKNKPLLTTNRRHLLFLITLFPSSSVLASGLDLVSPEEKQASSVITRRVDEAVELLEKGREFQAQGDFTQALLFFTQVIESYKDLALSDYARVGRALALYEVGNRDDSIAEMEDVSISLKGYPEVHAALAAALYVDKHAPLLAENQFTIATLLDPRYTDISFVTKTKHWPPSLRLHLPEKKENKENSFWKIKYTHSMTS